MKKTLAIFATALLLAGCASTEIDWNRQVGEMDFDQAVSLLGTPDKTEKLDSGQLVAQWVSHYNNSAPPATDDSFQYHPASPGLGHTGTAPEESTLKLTFGTNGLLSAWGKQ